MLEKLFGKKSPETKSTETDKSPEVFGFTPEQLNVTREYLKRMNIRAIDAYGDQERQEAIGEILGASVHDEIETIHGGTDASGKSLYADRTKPGIVRQILKKLAQDEAEGK